MVNHFCVTKRVGYLNLRFASRTFRKPSHRMSDVKPAVNEEPPGRRPRRGLRRFRLWEKKRGSRQTGSSWLGAAGETVFFAALFLGGVTVLTELVSLRLIRKTENLLTSNLGMFFSIPILTALIITGAVGAIYSVLLTGTSAERRAAIAKRAKDSDLLSETQGATQVYPAIPDATNWKNSPGIRLAYRLPAASSPSWRLVLLASFCLLWNGAVAVLAVLAANQGDAFRISSLGSPAGWSLFRVIVALYACVGAWSIHGLFRNLLAATAIGPTSVEVSALPLQPGGQYRVFLTQAGHLKIDWLELTLVCDEEVSFSDGTDTRTETKRIFETSLFRKELFEVHPSQPFQVECPLDVPLDAMHSLVTENNAVNWMLIVSASAKKWPTFQRVFPLLLHPSPEPST